MLKTYAQLHIINVDNFNSIKKIYRPKNNFITAAI